MTRLRSLGTGDEVPCGCAKQHTPAHRTIPHPAPGSSNRKVVACQKPVGTSSNRRAGWLPLPRDSNAWIAVICYGEYSCGLLPFFLMNSPWGRFCCEIGQRTLNHWAESRPRRFIDLWYVECRIFSNKGVSRGVDPFQSASRCRRGHDCRSGARNISSCGPDGMGGRIAGHVSASSHICTCILKTGHCSCGAACHCGRHLPQKNNDPAAPNSSNDRGQSLGLAEDFAAINPSTITALRVQFELNPLSSSNQTLVAQCTRINV